MEKNRRSYWIQNLFRITVTIEILMVGVTANTTIEDSLPQTTESPLDDFQWSAWGPWTRCSRTCGGGVAVQKRTCVPRIDKTSSTTVIPELMPTLTRVSRQTLDDTVSCVGISERYHECYTAPCPNSLGDSRAEQCSQYDRRPFKGRFYTWIPYIDGNAQCALNCRPLGQQFYASLGVVADGTSCTRPGFRAICVEGACKVVGREGVLSSSWQKEFHCGRRLVSGLFARPRLPLGYSYVTTVPSGACRLNVTEIMSTENYIAIKITNGSYIINGEFAVSAPGTYEAVGSRFFYSRNQGADSIYAIGPIHHAVDIMILYTQPNPSIKYEYLTENLPGVLETESITKAPEVSSTPYSKHIRRHHGYDAYSRHDFSSPKHLEPIGSKEVDNDIRENVVGTRKFIWKIISYSQCTRTCGGGIQVGKYRCVEVSSNIPDREISPVHCLGSPPPGRRRRCSNIACPARWRAAAWSSCPKCGPASKTRIVGCVQDHSRGITKISDSKCTAPKPATTEECNIPGCETYYSSGEVIQVGKRVTQRENVDAFRDGPVYTVSVNNSDLDIGPEYSFSATAGWLHTEWSDCVGWCIGGGVQSRSIRCSDPAGCTLKKAPDTSITCTPKLSCDPHDGQWFTGDWSACSSKCNGMQIRGVLCIGGTGRHLKDSACKTPRPNHQRTCADECTPAWYFSDWTPCKSNCTTNTGVQRRTVWCAKGDTATEEAACPAPKPLAQRVCVPDCPTVSSTTPAFTIESQKKIDIENEILETTTTKPAETTKKECEDKLSNCMLAVQARLCHYNYYVQNCCHSCRGR